MSTRGGERWDRDRFSYERDIDIERDRYEDDRHYMRGGRGGGGGRSERGRAPSDDRFDRSRYGRSQDGRSYDDDFVRDRRYYEEDRFPPRREPERAPERGTEYDRHVVMEKERDRDYYRDPEPRRPAFMRRQSSLDTFDRRPLRREFYERDEYPVPVRREDIRRDDFRAPPYTPIPLPKTKALGPPPRRRYDDINVADPELHGDDEFRPYPERIHEREIIRDRRDRSRESHATRAHTHRSHSRNHRSHSRASSSSSSRSGGTSVRSEYPKKGKTRIPVRLVSKRALMDMGYPYLEEGNTVIVQRALGQDNIDELLRLSEDYNKAEEEIAAARSPVDDRREEIYVPPPPPPAPVTVAPPPQTTSPPVIIDAGPRYSQPPVEAYERTVIRDASPSRATSVSSWDSHRHHHHHDTDAVALVHRSRSHSRHGRDIRHEIRSLERELAHRPRGEISDREVVRTERLPNGELVVYEEEVEREVAAKKPPRIEKDKKGRMSISVPKYR